MSKKVYSKEQQENFKKAQEGFSKRPGAMEEIKKTWKNFMGEDEEKEEEKIKRFKNLEKNMKP